MDTNEKLVAACWAMWGAIRQARSVDVYNDGLKSLYEIAEGAMVRAEQIEKEDSNND